MKKVKKKTPVSSLKNKIWLTARQIIKKREFINGVAKCFTCDNEVHIDDTGKYNIGHFLHDGRTKSKAWFDLRNIHIQCTTCNLWKHGNLAEYTVRMQEKYGLDIYYELKQMKFAPSMTHEELEDMLEEYKRLLNENIE